MSRLYIDYCPRCPRPVVTDDKGRRRNAGPDPSECKSCSPKTLEQHLREYVEAERSSSKLQSEIVERERGVAFYTDKRAGFLTQIEKDVKQGSFRVIKLYQMAVVLDYRGSELVISYAPFEDL